MLFKLQIKSTSVETVTLHTIRKALITLAENGIISESIARNYWNQVRKGAWSTKAAIRYIRKYAKLSVKPIATNGTVTKYKIYLSIDEPTSFPDIEPALEPKLMEDHPDADAINNYIGNDESINDEVYLR